MTSNLTYVVVPTYADGDPRNALTNGPHGSPGRYRVTFVLAVPGRYVVQDSVDFDEAVQQGDSLLVVPPSIHEIRIDFLDTDRGDLVSTARINEHHRVRDISIEFDADSFHEAAKQGYDFLIPVLSRWSFIHDVAMTTSGLLLEELATGARSMEVTIIGAVKAFSDDMGSSNPEHRALLAAYREGLSSAEPLWRALSLYKVAEGVWALRAKRRKAALDDGEQVNEPSERVPADVTAIGHPSDHEALAKALAPYAGKKFRVAFDDIRASLRNAIAHLNPATDPLVQDSWEDVRRVESALPALRWMSRQLLESELVTDQE